jgi:hypothetical protein
LQHSKAAEMIMKSDHSGQLRQLSARVTALTMLVEALWAAELAKDSDPKRVGQLIVDDLFQKEELVRDQVGESRYVLMVSEAVSSLIDRATARAELLRQKRSPG